MFNTLAGDTKNPHTTYLRQVVEAIDPEFVSANNLYINNEANENRGIITNDNIIVEMQKIQPTSSTNEMSGQEVYVHELVHSITRRAIQFLKGDKKNLVAADIVLQIQAIRNKAKKVIVWEDLMPTVSENRTKDKKEAQDRLKYMFEGENSLHEFIAHGLTNKQVIQKLQRMKVSSQKKDTTMTQQLLNLFKDLIETVFGYKKLSNLGKNQAQVLHSLTFELMQHNNKAVNEIQRNEGVAVKLAKFLDKIGNDPLKKIMDNLVEKWDNDMDLPPAPPKNATKFETVAYLVKYLPKLLTRKNMKPFREIVLSALGAKPENILQNIIRDVSDADELELAIEKMGLASDSLDRARELIVATTREEIQEKFSKPLSKAEESIITLVGIDNDLSGIYSDYGSNKIEGMLRDRAKLQRRIKTVTTQLARLDRTNFNWNNNQSIGLGYYLATGIAGIAQNLNANNIAARVLTNNIRIPDKKVVNKINELSTLQALLHTNKDAKNELADLIKNEPEGIAHVMDLNEGIKKDSDRLFENEVLKVKGYSKQLFDDTMDISIKPENQLIEMEANGYTYVKTLTKDKNDPTSIPMALYTSKLYTNNSYNRAATRMTDMAKKGTSMTDISFSSEGTLQKERAKASIAKIDDKRKEVVKSMEDGTYEIDPDARLAPLLNQHGKVVDYRYMMDKHSKKELLNQDTTVSEVLGRTLGSIGDKIGTQEQNENVLKVIIADMKKYYVDGASLGKNNKEYMVISKDSPHARVRDIYAILPSNMKQAIKDSDRGYIAVRRDMVSNYFGFRDESIIDLFHISGITPAIIQKWVKIAEKVWMELVKVSKVDIIIRTPAVFIGNFISNLWYSVVMGASPLRVLKMQVANMKNVTKYLQVEKELQKLKTAKLLGKKVDKSIATLDAEQALNPVHDLMVAGMYQAIIEDLDKQTLKSGNRIARRFEGSTDKLPEWVRTGTNWMYLNENTSYYQLVTQATQYSDFIARATEYQLLAEKGVPKAKRLQTVLDAFVNYGKPASSFEEYLNNIGFFMFTKYAKRIQRAIRHSGRTKPLNVLLSIIGQELFFEIDDIQDQNVITRSYSNYDQDLFEHFKRVITPTGLEAVGIL